MATEWSLRRWGMVNTAAAVALFGAQAVQGLVVSGWLMFHPVPAGQAALVTLCALTCAAPLMVWVARSRRPDAERSLRGLYGWAATMLVIQLLQIPMTKALLSSIPLYPVMAGVLITVSELVRVAAGIATAIEPTASHRAGAAEENLRSHP